MITSITVANFKGIGERFRLPVKPLTLLFGPNSAGKSTILQAIHYAREVLERRNLDAEHVGSGGGFVELGGFRNFVHDHDLRRRITLQFGFSLDRSQHLPTFDFWDSAIEDQRAKSVVASAPKPRTAAVEFSVSWSDRGVYASEYIAELDGERIGRIAWNTVSDSDRENFGLLDVNFNHAILKGLDADLDEIEERHESREGKSLPDAARGKWRRLKQGIGELAVWDQPDALPDFHARHGLIAYYEGSSGDDSPLGYGVLNSLLSRLVVGPVVLLHEQLAQLRYLGPLRSVPGRSYNPPRLPDPRRWTTGLAAWDALYSSQPGFVEHVSDWMSRPDRLDAGYRVRQKNYALLDFESDLRKRILSHEAARDPDTLAREVTALPASKRVVLQKSGGEGDVEPQDVGMGISQVLPVVVSCLEPGQYLTCIEQPELHLHPRMQCALGDLLIKGSVGHEVLSREPVLDEDGDDSERERALHAERHPRVFIVETHSEHLILRILRRVRETSLGKPHDRIPVTPDDLSVCYISQEGGESVPRTLRIDERGEFIDRWPRGFFDERAEELFS